MPSRVAPLERALELDEEALATECSCKSGGAVRVAEREPVARAPREADEALVQLGDGRERDGGLEEDAMLLALGARPRVRGREDAAEVRVARPALAQRA